MNSNFASLGLLFVYFDEKLKNDIMVDYGSFDVN